MGRGVQTREPEPACTGAVHQVSCLNGRLTGIGLRGEKGCPDWDTVHSTLDGGRACAQSVVRME